MDKERSASPPRTLHYASSCVIPTSWTPLPLLEKRAVNHDSWLFDFGLPPLPSTTAEHGHTLHLPVCSCLLLRAPGCEHASKGGGDAVRPYTPVSAPTLAGRFTLLVKVYREWGDPAYAHSYRPAGAVSNYLAGLRPGVDTAQFCHVARNVKVPLPFPAAAVALSAGSTRPPLHAGVKTLTMVAVGAGVAPMVQALELLLASGGACMYWRNGASPLRW